MRPASIRAQDRPGRRTIRQGVEMSSPYRHMLQYDRLLADIEAAGPCLERQARALGGVNHLLAGDSTTPVITTRRPGHRIGAACGAGGAPDTLDYPAADPPPPTW